MAKRAKRIIRDEQIIIPVGTIVEVVDYVPGEAGEMVEARRRVLIDAPAEVMIKYGDPIPSYYVDK